ncbi:MAG: FadR/GntR family transcriptional regulator [Kiloniellales bacterium]
MTLTEEIAGVLRERVSNGLMAPGDRLPSEQQLAESFEVSRTVIREAMSRLKFEGLIDTRQGLGAFVAESLPHARLDTEDIAKKQRIPSVFELRVALEPTSAALAAQRRSKSELKQLERHLLALRKSVETGEGGPEADTAFHLTIAEASGNALFVSLTSFIQSTLRAGMQLSHANTARVEGGPARVQNEHEVIYWAIHDQDPNAAAEAMSDHLHNAAGRLSINTQLLRSVRARDGEAAKRK